MKKSDAIQLFGSGASLARAVGLSRSRVSQWPDPLTQKQADLVTGAAMRLGKVEKLKTKNRKATKPQKH